MPLTSSMHVYWSPSSQCAMPFFVIDSDGLLFFRSLFFFFLLLLLLLVFFFTLYFIRFSFLYTQFLCWVDFAQRNTNYHAILWCRSVCFERNVQNKMVSHRCATCTTEKTTTPIGSRSNCGIFAKCTAHSRTQQSVWCCWETPFASRESPKNDDKNE